MSKAITYRIATIAGEFEQGKTLFMEYAESLGVDLSFQGFNDELAGMDKQYGRPAGALLLAFCDGLAVGCAGIRRLDDTTAELKRMYVQPGYRGRGIGFELLDRCATIARQLGYKKVRLDTLKDMARAQQLYRSYGFYEIPPYRFNPVEGTIYMEKEL